MMLQCWTRMLLTLLAITMITTSCRGQKTRQSNDPALLAAVDSLMPALERISGLKKIKPITMRHQSRADLRKYVEERLNEEMPTSEIEGMRAAYAALGLVADTLNIRQLLLDLYTEQVAGYYDPKTDAFYMVEGTAQELLRPTLAHELVHALQDQHVNLDSLISRKRGNDRQTAAQAAMEGHATLVMFAVLADASGKFEPSMLPDMGEQLGPLMEAQNSEYPVFKRAPRIIRETMLFPYIGGASFVQALWRSQASAAEKFPSPLGERLPQSTEQVLHPNRFLMDRDDPSELRFTQAAPGKLVYENTLGELEIGILLTEHLGTDDAAYGWDGDRYRVVEINGKNVLMWQTVWDDVNAAQRFAAAYRKIASKRPNRAVQVEMNLVGDAPGVWIVDAPSGFDVRAVRRLSVGIAQ